MNYQNRLYIWSPVLSRENRHEQRLHNDSVASSTRHSTMRGGGAVLIGFHHHGEPGLPSMTVFATVSRGYWLPIDGVHWLDLEFTPESLESLNTVGRFFFLERGDESSGICRKDSEVIFIKRLETLFWVQTVFHSFSSSFMTSLVR